MEHSGQSSTSKYEENFQKVRKVICSYRHLTVCEVAEDVRISKTTCREILTENLAIHGVAVKFVVLLLSEYRKQNHVDVSKGLVDSVTTDENFLKNIVTVEEKLGLWL
jgi:hypothetical protein